MVYLCRPGCTIWRDAPGADAEGEEESEEGAGNDLHGRGDHSQLSALYLAQPPGHGTGQSPPIWRGNRAKGQSTFALVKMTLKFTDDDI